MNEPEGGCGIAWSDIKTHADSVICAIRTVDDMNRNICLVPAPDWAQTLSAITSDGSWDRPDRLFGNIAYKSHFYAGTHFFQNEVSYAVNAGLALFCSEFGLS